MILDVIFTSPLLADDLDLVSTPISYITYQVRPQDGKSHEVQVYFEASPQLAVHEDNQPVVYDRELNNGISYGKSTDTRTERRRCPHRLGIRLSGCSPDG